MGFCRMRTRSEEPHPRARTETEWCPPRTTPYTLRPSHIPALTLTQRPQISPLDSLSDPPSIPSYSSCSTKWRSALGPMNILPSHPIDRCPQHLATIALFLTLITALVLATPQHFQPPPRRHAHGPKSSIAHLQHPQRRRCVIPPQLLLLPAKMSLMSPRPPCDIMSHMSPRSL